MSTERYRQLEKWPAAIFRTLASLPAAKGATFAACASGSAHLLQARAWLRRLGVPALAACAALLGGCSGNAHIDVADSQSADPATIDFPIFYVKRTIPPDTDDLRMLRDAVLPTDDQLVVPKADLFKRQSASPSADEINITARITGTDTYDIKDVDVSLDGKAVVFAMRGPLTVKMKQKDAPTWHLWEYVIATDTLRQVIPASLVPDESNNVAPHYMPDGRIVFSPPQPSGSRRPFCWMRANPSSKPRTRPATSRHSSCT